MAENLAQRILNPGLWDAWLESGVFLLASSGVSASLFVDRYLASALFASGMRVVKTNARDLILGNSLALLQELIRLQGLPNISR